MRVAVTGATGFTGGHTLRALVDAGHEPVALVRSPDKLAQVQTLHGLDPVEHVTGDVTDPTAVAELLDRADSVIHTAAVAFIGIRHVALIEATNVPATRLVLEGAAQRDLDPIVHVSSQSAIHPPKGGVYRSDSPLSPDPVGAYAASKVASERIAKRLQDDGHPVVIVLPSGITGPDDVGLSVTAEGTSRLLRQNTLPLPRSGGNLMHDVRDLAQVLARCIEPDRGARRYGVFGHFLPWDDMAALIDELAGRTMKVRRLPDGFFHGLGLMGDLLGRVKVDFPLDRSAAHFMTAMCPGDDADTRADLGLEWRPIEETYGDLLRWLIQEGHLDASKAPALA